MATRYAGGNNLFRTARIKVTLLLVALLVGLYLIMAGGVYVWVRQSTLASLDNVVRFESFSLLSRGAFVRLLIANVPALQVPIDPILPPFFFGGNGSSQSGQGQPPFAHSLSTRLRDMLDPNFAIAVYSPTQKLLYSVGTSIGTPQLSFVASKGQSFFTTQWTDHGKILLRTMTVEIRRGGNLLGFLSIGYNATRELTVLSRLIHILLVVGIGGALLALLGSFYASGRALSPIARSWERQRQFVGDASHELRTPLAVIQSNLDIVLTHAHEGVMDNLEWLNNAKAEARRLTRLTEDLLTLARADSTMTPLRNERVDLQKIAEGVHDAYAIYAESKDIQFLLERSADDAYVTGDADRLHQLFVILLDNAIKYTQEGGRVTLREEVTKGTIVVTVEDSGIGIDKSEQGLVFERFYRSDVARERETGGLGLGLSIAKWIVEAHRGRISVESTLGVGTTFRVTLPRAAGVHQAVEQSDTSRVDYK
ncbi:sensor histidine kinase [Ferroacidibacillus organovorans]|uniref:histidine kinase n=1 Tax=Ferroacidibacillus organovorans TaxID=1765683 RepID=A0A161QEP7_9BACL|nr:ATP-binding protein [Ferroacidibacillus organovorans]KYP80290.1 hypothetical protein AYJ22_11855 [Ferroacidibacillus organovorans]OAG93368.1 hypothetical protein AYW79_11010 [Ferroacidibacillus organovorans]OPG15903.1 sensor histidine kinase [Ferroacidibacillus organovorans]